MAAPKKLHPDIPKSRSGCRPISVDKLLQREKDGAMFKGAEYGDTEPLWMDNNVGHVDYESKVPVKLNPRITAPGAKPGDVPSNNVSGIGVRAEDGRDNATTIMTGGVANGDVVPDAMPSNYKMSSCLSELHKLGAINDDEAQRTLDQLEALETNKFTPGQVGRYALLGAAAGPAVGVARNLIREGKPFGRPGWRYAGRSLAADAIGGAVTSGAIPMVRSAMDRIAAKNTLAQFMREQNTVPAVAPPSNDMAEVKAAGWLSGNTAETATDIGGLTAMMAGSGSHLYSAIKGQDNAESPIPGKVQHGLDLAGLAGMALPSAAALMALRRGHTPEAGGGKTWVNAANLAGLVGLAIPTADTLQAKLRAAPGEDPESKTILNPTTHKLMELGGYGALAAPVIANTRAKGFNAHDASLLGGYGLLAATPHVLPAGEPTPEDPHPGLAARIARPAAEMAGLGALMAPTIAHAVR